MVGVWYAALAAAFILGVLFVGAYARRGNSAPTGRRGGRPEAAQWSIEAAREPQPGEEQSDRPLVMSSEGGPSQSELARESRAEIEALLRAAEAAAEATRQAARAEAQSLSTDARTLRGRAESDAVEIVDQARRAAERESETARRARDEHSQELAEIEQRLRADERRISADGAELDRSIRQLAAEQQRLAEMDAEFVQRKSELEQRAGEIERRATAIERELERVAGLTAEEAKAELMTGVEAGARRDAALLVRTIENEARAEGTDRARSIVVEAVQRVASEQTSETVVSVLHLPSEEMKGRIIGREGRNIRAYESTTGVNLIIDDTPEAVLLSCFDPVRREVGRLTLDKLILDGRIHPHRIEEAYEQSKVEVDDLCLRAARDALADVGITDLDERLIPTLGRLKYRTSYGQNVLGHLVETAHIAGVMAAELGLEPTLIKRCAFLHDIGKALTHEVEGSHAIIGAELLRKYGEADAVAHAVEAHHNEIQPRTIEAVLTQASDTCSAARPGARRESLESYVKRLARIEEIAGAKPGVDKVFAMQSGREVRVMVQPTEVDDLAASVIAREIAKQIEDELTYPGQIRVTVVREWRTTEIAH